MDPQFIKTLFQLGTYGPLGIMAALGFWLFLLERKKTVELTAKLIEFAKASVLADAEHTKAMEALGNLYDLGIDSTKASLATTNALASLTKSIDQMGDELRSMVRNEPKRR